MKADYCIQGDSEELDKTLGRSSQDNENFLLVYVAPSARIAIYNICGASVVLRDVQDGLNLRIGGAASAHDNAKSKLEEIFGKKLTEGHLI